MCSYARPLPGPAAARLRRVLNATGVVVHTNDDGRLLLDPRTLTDDEAREARAVRAVSP